MDLEKYQQLLKDKTDLGEFATFVPNKFRPVYNWFYYKEGFSKELADFFLDSFNPTRVLDPFCGSGTTLLACRQRGINAVGVDAMPISIFAARVKTQDYDLSELERIRKQIMQVKFRQISMQFPKFFYRYFSKYVLADISLFLSRIYEMEEPSRSFFLLALINSAVRASWAFKDGAVLKVRKQGNNPLRKMLARVTSRMIKDLGNFSSKPCDIKADVGDARQLELGDSSVDAIITSPPYLNNIDYTKVYSIENWFVGQSEPTLRSYMGMKSEEDVVFLDLPVSANAYFKDMKLALQEMHRILKPGGKAAIVVGNAYYSDIDLIVDSDLILSAMAEELVFHVNEILVLNKRYALENRTIKKGVLRESAVVMEKL